MAFELMIMVLACVVLLFMNGTYANSRVSSLPDKNRIIYRRFGNKAITRSPIEYNYYTVGLAGKIYLVQYRYQILWYYRCLIVDESFMDKVEAELYTGWHTLSFINKKDIDKYIGELGDKPNFSEMLKKYQD